ncbi:spore cortex biosynthesis protein YabQ [Lederbergia lenta]|uniref:Spore cortex biosynthesis protein YabQ n=1 Tax=Lederbergia lenta TaxID=1467 RepID=A0A2X4VWX3_LEDLE|nr:spore cortex biosynthesis protein YabQ [Lederbergia lenta]MEC2323839.1 spore cortex biosynthesis protein YabQ [Lederbergia lenta]SQI51142.1 spore cortex biosynthesis protein YabQ [Lederbergia lenta]
MTLSVQLYTMLAMITMGSLFGAALDTYQRFLKRDKRKRVIVFINDILFWMLQGLIIFYVLFLVNYGEIRFYLVLSLLCGFSAYQAFLKKYYLAILEYLILFIQSAAILFYKLIYMIIYQPIKWIVIFIFSLLILTAKLLLGLVKTVVKMLLWMLKIILYPIYLLGKGIWTILPQSVQKIVRQLKSWFISYFIFLKDKFSDVISFFQAIFSKLK